MPPQDNDASQKTSQISSRPNNDGNGIGKIVKQDYVEDKNKKLIVGPEPLSEPSQVSDILNYFEQLGENRNHDGLDDLSDTRAYVPYAIEDDSCPYYDADLFTGK